MTTTTAPQRGLHHPGLEGGDRRRGRGVAGHDQELRAPAQEVLGDLEREAPELVAIAVAVGEARGIPEVEEVLVG